MTASTWWSLGDTGASFTVEPNVAIGWNYGGGDPGNAWGPVFIDIDSDHKLVVVADASGGFYLWVVDCTIPAAPIIGPSYAQGAAYGLTEQTLAVTGQSIFVTSGPFAATEIVQLYWDPATLAISSVGSQTGSNASAQERIVLLTDTMLLCSNGSSEWNTLPITGGVLQPVSGTISVNSTLHPLVVPSTYGGNIILCSDIGSTTTLQAVLPSGSTGTPATLPAGSPTTQLSFSIDGQTDQFWQFQVVNGFPLRDLYLFAVDSAGNLTSTLAASAQEANWADQQFLPAPTMEGVAPVGSVTRSTIPRLNIFELASSLMQNGQFIPMTSGGRGPFDINHSVFTDYADLKSGSNPQRGVSNPRRWGTSLAVATLEAVEAYPIITFSALEINVIEIGLAPNFPFQNTDFELTEITAPTYTPPTRQYPRDDNLALGAVRQAGRSTSLQNSIRQGSAGTYS